MAMSWYYGMYVAILKYYAMKVWDMAFTAAEKFILRRLYRDSIINERHTAIENLSRGVPSHMRGEMQKAAKRLLKMGYLLPKTTGYGLQVSLNHNLLSEIEREIGGD
jgi:hypothetical protein